MEQTWMQIDSLIHSLNQSIQHTNRALASDYSGGTPFVLTELSMELAVYTKAVKDDSDNIQLVVKFPEHDIQDQQYVETSKMTQQPVSQIRMTLKPTVTFTSNGVDV